MAKKTPTEVTLSFNTDCYYTEIVQRLNKKVIKGAGFSSRWVFRFQSVVDELINNAIEHGSAKGEMVTLRYLVIPEDRLEVQVTDTGTNLEEKTTASDLQKKVADRKEAGIDSLGSIRGRGLPFIVSNWMDEMKFEDTPEGGLQCTVVKKLNSETTAKEK